MSNPTTGRKPLRVAVTLLVDVDPTAWDAAYGTGTKVAEVRADVLSQVLATVQNSAPADEGGITEVTLKR